MVLGRQNHVPAAFVSEDGKRPSHNPLKVLLLCVGKTEYHVIRVCPEGGLHECVCLCGGRGPPNTPGKVAICIRHHPPPAIPMQSSEEPSATLFREKAYQILVKGDAKYAVRAPELGPLLRTALGRRCEATLQPGATRKRAAA